MAKSIKFIEKVKLVYLPYLKIAAWVIIGYTFLNWLLVVKLDLIPFHENAYNFFVPILIPGIPIFLLLRKKIRLLNSKKSKKNSLTDFFIACAWISIGFSAIFSQGIMHSYTGQLTEIENIETATNIPNTRFYRFNDFYLDYRQSGTSSSFDVSGRNNANYNMHLYFVLPIYADRRAANTVDPIFYLVHEERNSISNYLSSGTKKIEFDQWAPYASLAFKRHVFSKTATYEFNPKLNDYENYEEALKDTGINTVKNSRILKELNYDYESRNEFSLVQIFLPLILGSIVFFIGFLYVEIDNKKAVKLSNEKQSVWKDIKVILNTLKPKGDYFVVLILAYINILVFVIMMIQYESVISFKGEELVDWGANYQPNINKGEWWRFFTSTFLHGGFLHLFYNLFGLIIGGFFIEAKLGRKWMLILYIISGLIASYASYYWHDATVSIGASGAVFGLFGFFLFATIYNRILNGEKNKIVTFLWLYIALNLGLGFFGNTDNAAHIGGLITGVVFGIFYVILIKINKTKTTS